MYCTRRTRCLRMCVLFFNYMRACIVTVASVAYMQCIAMRFYALQRIEIAVIYFVILTQAMRCAAMQIVV